MKILLFIWYAYATGTHFGTHFEILGGTLFGTQFTEKSTLGPEKYLVTLITVPANACILYGLNPSFSFCNSEFV